MSSINSVTQGGRLGAAPELRHTGEGRAVLNFSIANSHYNSRKKEDDTSWFDCTFWGDTEGKRAAFFADVLEKGQEVVVQGVLRQDKWQTESGENRYRVFILVYEITSGRKAGEGGGGGEKRPVPEPEFAAEPVGAAASSDHDDIPF